MKFFGAGLAQKGRLLRRVCFPCRNEKGQIIGFSGRWYSDKLPTENFAKWKFVGRKTNFIFPGILNRDEIRKAGQVILVESIGDLLALWEAGVKNTFCIFGASLTKRHMSYVSCLEVDDVVIALNDDKKEDGTNPGQEGALKALERLNEVMDAGVVRIVRPTKNDFGEMSIDEILEWKNALDAVKK
jgi:DNA primase